MLWDSALDAKGLKGASPTVHRVTDTQTLRPTADHAVVHGPAPAPLGCDFPDGPAGKESACKVGDTGDTVSIPGLGRSPGGGNDNPLQCSLLPEKSHGQRNLQAKVQRTAKSQT